VVIGPVSQPLSSTITADSPSDREDRYSDHCQGKETEGQVECHLLPPALHTEDLVRDDAAPSHTEQITGPVTHLSAMLAPVTNTAAACLLDGLRGVGTPRPSVDPELAGGLREWLEDSLSGQITPLGSRSRAIRVDNRMFDAFPAHGQVPTTSSHRTSAIEDVVLRALVRSLFRQWTTTGRIEDPLGDALSAQAVSGDPEGAVDLLSRMADEERHLYAEAVRMHAARIAATWPALSPAWLPRSQERLTVPLCGGRVVLCGTADLVVGPQAASEASVCLVEIETERRATGPRPHVLFLALLETLRAGAPPSRVATYYTGTGELDAEPVDEHLLVQALLRVVAAVEEICSRELSLASHIEPTGLAAAPIGAFS
jgi:hypothetical protein